MSDSAETATGLGSADDRDPDDRGSRAVRERRGNPVSRALRAIAVFYRQVVAELRKVVWHTQEQLITYFIVVMVFVIAMMALVSALDLAFGKLVFALFTGGNNQ